MSVEYLDVVDYIAIAVEGTGLSVETIERIADLGLADSALHAPAAGHGDTEVYPDFVDKAAVLIVHSVVVEPFAQKTYSACKRIAGEDLAARSAASSPPYRAWKCGGACPRRTSRPRARRTR